MTSKIYTLCLLLTLSAITLKAQNVNELKSKPDTGKAVNRHTIDEKKAAQLKALMSASRVEVTRVMRDTTINPGMKRVMYRQLIQIRNAKVDSILGYKRERPPIR